MPSRRSLLVVWFLVPLGVSGCGRSNPASSDLLIDPIRVEGVECSSRRATRRRPRPTCAGGYVLRVNGTETRFATN